MPILNMYGRVGGSDSDENLAVFLALCARMGITEVFCPGGDYQSHFFALGHGILLNYCPDYKIVDQVVKKIETAGIKVMPYPGRITLDHEWELEKLEHQLQEVARNAAARYLFECPKCHRGIGDEKFCPYCGIKVDPHLVWCAKCKLGFPPSFRYCSHCGGLLQPSGADWYNYTDPGYIFEGVYLKDEEANKPTHKTGDEEA